MESKQLRRRSSIRLAVVLVAAITAAACSSASGGTTASAKPYTFAYISDLTQGNAVFSTAQLNGFKAYIDYTNKNGGVNGHKINVTVADDQSDTNTGRVALQAAQSGGALGVFGGQTSSVWVALATQAKSMQLLQFTSGISDQQVDPSQPYLYSDNVASSSSADVQVSFVKNYIIPTYHLPKHPTVGIIRYSSAFTQEIDTSVKALAAQLGWKVVVDVNFPLGATDVSSPAEQVAVANPDVLIPMISDPNAPLVMSTLRKDGYKGPAANFLGGSSESTFKAIDDPSYYSGRIFVPPIDKSVPGAVTEASRAKATGNTTGEDNQQFSAGYVMAQAAVIALQKCGNSCTPVKFNTAMGKVGSIDTDGLNPNVAITASRHRLVGAMLMFHWDPSKGISVGVGNWIKTTT
jgi:branched-chain amino acid transport system substrate-binding protein